MNRKLYQLQKLFPNAYRPAIIITMTILLFSLSCISIRPKQYNIRVNQVAEQTIRAPYTTIDEERTQELKQRAKESVTDIYSYQSQRRQTQLDLLNAYFNGIRQMRKETYSTNDLQEWYSELAQLDDSLEISTKRLATQLVEFDQLTSDEKWLVYLHQIASANESLQLLSEAIEDNTIRSLYQLPQESIVQIQSELATIIADQLMLEITADKVEETVNSVITQLNENRYDAETVAIMTKFLQQLIVPTVVFDEEATELAKETAANQVQSIYILQGQVIAQEGYVIDSETIRLLNIYGILNNQTQVYTLYIFVGVLILHAILLYFYVEKWNNQQSRTSRNRDMRLTAYAISFVSMYALLVLLSVLQGYGLKESLYLFPAGLVPLLLIPHTDNRTGIFASIFFNLLSLFILNAQDNISIVVPAVYYFMSMMIVLLLIRIPYERYSIKFKSLFYWQSCLAIVVLLALNFDFSDMSTWKILSFMVLSVLLMIMIYFIIFPYWQQILDDRAELTLNELANLNHPLLQQLIKVAPGTYHHSILVANLSANAVEAIGGDSLFTRVASYYHDVGKIQHPLFFVENLPQNMTSPHQLLSPQESAEIIIGHVTHGVSILQEHQMPQSIIDVCRQHHGTTTVKYFYYQAKKENPDVSIDLFKYPGPVPQSKEIAVIMIADSVEAASRSLKEHTLEAIDELVSKIIQGKIDENQFCQTALTVHELKIVKESLIQGLASMFHTRVKYPD